jgi:hypothetical protein
MSRVLGVALFALFVTSGAIQNKPSPLEGEWTGTYKTAQSEGELFVKVGRANGPQWTVAVRAVSSYGPGEYRPTTDVTVEGDKLSFTVEWGAPVRFKGQLKQDVLSGDLASEHFTGTWTTKRKP